MQTATTSASATTLAPQAHHLILSTTRRLIMHRMNSAVFTAGERLRANDSVYQCEDLAQLALWHKNVCRVELEREVAQATSPASTAYATNAQKEEIVRLCGNKVITPQEKTKALLRINLVDEDEAEAVIETLVQAIWDRSTVRPTHLVQLTDWLDATGIAHRHLLTA